MPFGVSHAQTTFSHFLFALFGYFGGEHSLDTLPPMNGAILDVDVIVVLRESHAPASTLVYRLLNPSPVLVRSARVLR